MREERRQKDGVLNISNSTDRLGATNRGKYRTQNVLLGNIMAKNLTIF